MPAEKYEGERRNASRENLLGSYCSFRRKRRKQKGGGFHPLNQYAPSPEKTAIGVCIKIFRSINIDQEPAYCRSRRTISSNVVLLLPVTCHNPVIPGFTSIIRCRCQTS